MSTSPLLSLAITPSLPFSPIQVEPSAAFLNTNDVFVLKSPNTVFLWRGVGATEEELAAAQFVTSFLGGGSATEVSEGKEPGGCFSLTPNHRHNITYFSDDRIHLH